MRWQLRLWLTLAAVVHSAGTQTASAQTLFQQPAVNRTHIVFGYADDLWSVPRAAAPRRG